MNSREKMAGAAAAVIVVMVACYWMISGVIGAYSQRHRAISTLEADIEKQQDEVRKGKLATAKLKAWEQQSLSSEVNRAQTQYRVWLLKEAGKAGLKETGEPNLVAVHKSSTPRGKLYVQHLFQVQGEAPFGKLLEFVHTIHNTGYLHRIKSLTVTPKLDKKALGVDLFIEVLSLNAAPAESDNEVPAAEPPLEKDIPAYASVILNRNIFAPPNNPPRISATRAQGNPNKPLTVDVKVSDPDELDKHTFSLVSPGLDGARISGSGQISWTPPKVGRYELVVRVEDDGLPSLSAEETVRIEVAEPRVAPVQKPVIKDDPARYARISGIVGPQDQLIAWVTVPRGLGDQEKTLYLKAGDPISIGSFVGIVKDIRFREAEFELEGGRQVIVGNGQGLIPRDGESGGL